MREWFVRLQRYDLRTWGALQTAGIQRNLHLRRVGGL